MINKAVVYFLLPVLGFSLSWVGVLAVPEAPPVIKKPLKIQVTSTPSNALVFSGTMLKGRTPAELFVPENGKAVFTVKQQGFYDRNVILSSTSGSKVDVKLQPLPQGSVEIGTEPSGAAVYIDGVYTGTTPLSMDKVYTGEYLIRLVRPHYLPETEKISVLKGEKTAVAVKLDSKVESFYRSALAAEPGNIAFREELAHYYLINGRSEESAAEYIDAIQRIAKIPGADSVRFAEASRLVNEIRKIKNSHKEVAAKLNPPFIKTAEILAKREDVSDGSKIGFARKLAQLGMKDTAKLLLRSTRFGREQLAKIHENSKRADESEEAGQLEEASSFHVKVYDMYNRLGMDLYREKGISHLEKAFSLAQSPKTKTLAGYKLYSLYRRIGLRSKAVQTVCSLGEELPDQYLKKDRFWKVAEEIRTTYRQKAEQERIRDMCRNILKRTERKDVREQAELLLKRLIGKP